MIAFKRLEIRDFGVLEVADLDLADRGLVLVRAENHDTDAADSNGSGKTTLFHALSWVLFGEVVGASRPAEDIIRVGAKAAQVQITFSDGDHEYKVTRRRTQTKPKLSLTTDGASTTGRTQADTERRIREILGLDWDAFRNTVLYGQGDVKRFADADTTDSERKNVLKKILRMERIDDALKRVRADIKRMKGDKFEAVSDLRSVRTEVDTLVRQRERTDRSAEQWEAEQGVRLSDLEGKVQQLEDGAADDRAVAGQADRLKRLEDDLKVRLEERDRLYRIVDEVKTRYRAARADKIAAGRLVDPARRRLQGREDDLAAVDEGGVCPTCRTRLEDSTAALEHMGHLRAHRDAAQAELDTYRVDLANAELKMDEVEEEGHAAAAEAEAEDRWSDQMDTVQSHLRKVDAAAARVAVVDARRDELNARITAARRETNPHIQPSSRLAGEVVEGRKRIEKAEATVVSIEAREPGLRFWELAYSSRLPSFTLDSVVPFITEAANMYLGFLADGDLTVDIVTETELKNGGMKEEIDFVLTIEGNDNVRPSGGQLKKLSLAVDLALMDLVATREGAQIDLVLLDEVLDGLDAEGKSRVVALLRHLREYRSSIFVISHDPSIAEHFEHVVTVVKNGKKATLITDEKSDD